MPISVHLSSETIHLPDLSKIPSTIRKRSEIWGRWITKEIQRVTPVYDGPDPKRPPGTLRASMSPVIKEVPGGINIKVVSSDTMVANIVLGGSKPHFIPNSVSRKNLAFTTSDGTLIVRRAPFHHPGTSPNPFPAEADPQITDYLSKEAQKLMSRNIPRGA